MTRGPTSTPKRSRLGLNTALHRAMRTCLNYHQKLDPAFNNKKGRNLQAPLSPTRATTDPDDGTVAGSLKSTGDQTSSDSDLSKEDVADSYMDTTSGDCITCLDTDEVTIGTTQKKYWKKVWASCRLSKGNLWTKSQLKRISHSHQAMWGHDHESVQTEWDCTLMEDCNSFVQDDGQDWPTALHCHSHHLPNLHQRLRGWGQWLGKDSGIVTETIPHPLLLFLWKGND